MTSSGSVPRADGAVNGNGAKVAAVGRIAPELPADERRAGFWPARFRFSTEGTRFLIYLQPEFAKPSRVYINALPGTIGPGPTDDRIRTVDAKQKPPYKFEARGQSLTVPPWTGGRYRPIQPNRHGHFDRLRPGTRAFAAAAAFATARCALEIWEHAFGRRLPWSFLATYRHLEIIPFIESDNGWSGDGFIEFGFRKKRAHAGPLAEDFDIVAHEMGHLIFKSIVGSPPEDKRTFVYRAHEESSADFVSLVAALHFDEVAARALADTQGRLLSRNDLASIGKREDPRESRLLYHRLTMRSPSVHKARLGYDKHTYALPFSGALFDVLNAIYHDKLHGIGVLPGHPQRVTAAFRTTLHETQATFRELFKDAAPLFLEAVRQAREDFARLLATAWSMASADRFTFERAAGNLLAADRLMSGGQYAAAINALFTWRGIRPKT